MGENPAALRAAVFSLSSKNPRGGVQTPPPAGRGLMRCNLKCVFYIEKEKNRAVFGISHWVNKWLLMVATGLDSEYSQPADTFYNRGIIASSKLIFYWWIGNCPK